MSRREGGKQNGSHDVMGERFACCSVALDFLPARAYLHAPISIEPNPIPPPKNHSNNSTASKPFESFGSSPPLLLVTWVWAAVRPHGRRMGGGQVVCQMVRKMSIRGNDLHLLLKHYMTAGTPACTNINKPTAPNPIPTPNNQSPQLNCLETIGVIPADRPRDRPRLCFW